MIIESCEAPPPKGWQRSIHAPLLGRILEMNPGDGIRVQFETTGSQYANLVFRAVRFHLGAHVRIGVSKQPDGWLYVTRKADRL